VASEPAHEVVEPGALELTPRGFAAGLLAAAALAFLVHLGALGHGFVGDDHYLVERNRALHEPGALRRALRPGAWGQAADDWNREVNARFFRPVAAAWFVLDAHLFGTSPRGFHLVSLLAHVAATLLAGLALRRLTRSRLVGTVGALLFAVHAVHTEPVNMVTYRTTLAEALFCLGALVLEGAARDAATHARRAGWRALACVALAVALGSKETAVALPAVILLWHLLLPAALADDAPRGPWATTRSAALATLPYATLAAALLVWRAVVLPSASWTFFEGASRPTVVWSMLGVVTLYARLLLVPLRLVPFYDWSLVVHESPASFDVLLGALLALLLVALPWLWRGRSPRAALLLAGIGALLLPVMNIVPFTVAAGERLLYLPSVMFVGLVAVGVEALVRNGRRALPALLVVCMVAVHGAQSARRTADWRNDDSLLRAAVRDYPESVAARLQLARHLARGRGRLTGEAARSQACTHYRAAIARWPQLAPARVEAAALGCDRASPP
jgi:protein O-mannosyl-transferase